MNFSVLNSMNRQRAGAYLVMCAYFQISIKCSKNTLTRLACVLIFGGNAHRMHTFPIDLLAALVIAQYTQLAAMRYLRY